jgi:hypothetical protein
MASGKLGAAALAAETYTTVYTVPAGIVSTVNVLFVNRGPASADVRVALTTQAATPLVADFVEFGATVPGNGGVLERTALVAGPGEKVMVWASAADVSVRVHGFEGGQ